MTGCIRLVKMPQSKSAIIKARKKKQTTKKAETRTLFTTKAPYPNFKAPINKEKKPSKITLTTQSTFS